MAQQVNSDALDSYPMDKLIARLCENHDQATGPINTLESGASALPSACSSLPITPAVDSFTGTVPTTRPASASPNDRAASEELLRLKLELARAQNHISRVEQELAQTRHVNQASGRATPNISSDSDFAGGAPLVEPIGTKPSGNPPMPGFSKPQMPRDNWQTPASDDCRSDISDALSATGFNRSRGAWNNNNKFNYQNSVMPPPMPMQEGGPMSNWSQHRNQGFMDALPGYPTSSMESYRGDRYSEESELMRSGSGRRGNRYDNRFGGQSYGTNYGNYNLGQPQYDPTASYASGPGNMPGGGMNMFPQYGEQPVGSPLSPHATEFTSAVGSSWKPDVSLFSFLYYDDCRRHITCSDGSRSLQGCCH